MGPLHLRMAHQQPSHLPSQVRPLCFQPLWATDVTLGPRNCLVTLPQPSACLFQSSWRGLIAWHRAWPQIPKSLSSLMVDLPKSHCSGHPLNKSWIHPHAASSAASTSAYKALVFVGLPHSILPGNSEFYDVEHKVWSEVCCCYLRWKAKPLIQICHQRPVSCPLSWPMSDVVGTMAGFAPSKMNDLMGAR